MKTIRCTCSAAMLGATCLLAAVGAAADDAIEGVGPIGPVERVAEGFTFTEGPAADSEGNLYFTDVRANRIHRLGLDGELTTFLEDSQGCNGLMFDATGRLISCQGGAGRIVAIDVATKAITPLADNFRGERFDRPNDLSIDRAGGVYFTDPGRGRVFYVAPGGDVALAAEGMKRPNGLLLSREEDRLFVLPSGETHALVLDVARPGELTNRRVFCELEQSPTAAARGGDGLSIDDRGNLYFTQPALGAIQVVSDAGKTLGLVRVAENPSNCAFGGRDGRTLFITARTGVYAAPMKVAGAGRAKPASDTTGR